MFELMHSRLLGPLQIVTVHVTVSLSVGLQRCGGGLRRAHENSTWPWFTGWRSVVCRVLAEGTAWKVAELS